MSFTTLIPAYKPNYVNQLMTALQAQSLKPSRVIISDDSPDGAFLRMLGDPAHASIVERLNIEVVRGPCQGAWPNFQHLLRLHANRTPYLHILLDDDVLYPSFYARHLEAQALSPSGCVVSRRWYAHEGGQPTHDLRVPASINARQERYLALPGSVLFPTSLGVCTNWLGEFSNMTFSSRWTESLIQPLVGGIRCNGLEDIGSALMVAQTAPVAWINEHLGYFRLNPHQGTHQPMSRNFKRGALAWTAMAVGARRSGFLDEASAAASLAHSVRYVMRGYAEEADMQGFISVLPGVAAGDSVATETFLTMWDTFAS